jgi:hypothetical protein
MIEGGEPSEEQLSQPDLKPLVKRDGVVEKKRRPTGRFTRWQVAAVEEGELVRWVALDGRWVAIAAGYGASAGRCVVADSRGRFEAVDGYEDALALAKSWRT